MTKGFKYDVPTLIALVESRPCLWDKSLDSFKDRNERQKAWDEICSHLEKGYNTKDKDAQKKMYDTINGKWQNVRDSFVKSLKKKSDQPLAKKYIYHQHLKFLTKVVSAEDTESDSHNDEENSSRTEATEAGSPRKKLKLPGDAEVCSSSRKSTRLENIDQEILKALRTSKSMPDQDEAFFISITPAVRKLSEDNKLEFRMGVLQLIKDLNGRAKESVNRDSDLSSAPSLSRSNFPELDHADLNQESQFFKCE